MDQHSTSTPYDAAALAGAALAGALAAAVNPGPYDIFSAIISVTILLVIWAYERGRNRDFAQSLALAAVVAFVSLLLLGLPLELLAGQGSLDGVCALGNGNCRPNEYETAVPDWWLALTWIAVTAIVTAVDLQRQKSLLTSGV
ncbi:hypothetical protein [Roseateles violae]|uniref:Uncharacterized protein n=1 Tax=Roseateles violae TaxID=3058042 RepID=A0ABT8DYD5_9BURK|nr:hypothetical protein [Pelomonas sp. PFR6]MDN3922484.1 hypothetical protein [Pelomonas sp. PFR6]